MELVKTVEYYDVIDGEKTLTKSVETYNVDTEAEVDEELEKANMNAIYRLTAHSKKHKDAKISKKTGDILEDEYWILKLTKEL